VQSLGVNAQQASSLGVLGNWAAARALLASAMLLRCIATSRYIGGADGKVGCKFTHSHRVASACRRMYIDKVSACSLGVVGETGP
jgi:hypothetical protein